MSGYQSMVRKLTCDGNIDTLSIGDLVKLSYYAPEARRIVLQNFCACAEHELAVKQGQKVNVVYQEGDWAYVATDDKKQGYIPLNLCAKIGIHKPEVNNKINDVKEYTENVKVPRSKKCREILNERTVSIESAGSFSSCSDDGAYDSFTEWSSDSDDNNTSDITVQKRGVAGMTVINGQPIAYVRSNPYDRSPIVFEAVKGQQTHKITTLLETANIEDFDNPPSPTGMYRVLYTYKGNTI